ncbi:MAG: tryptophan synthase subunit alpha [Carnobacterium sp.]|nr:tryptophan synthase subunit alpha [Carnobacterium sp.]
MTNLAFYVPLHYPNRNDFFAILDTLEKHNAAYVEIGIPVKNPFMDGELIKEAHKLILEQELNHDSLIKTLKEIKKKYTFKVILMTYKEGVNSFSLKKIPDYLYEGLLCVDDTITKNDFEHPIQIYPPKIKEEEVISLLKNNELFSYVISGEGKTGTFSKVSDQYIDTIHIIKKHSSLPILVGFGIKTPQDIASVLLNGADGAIIGTEFLKKFKKEGLEGINDYLESFKDI